MSNYKLRPDTGLTDADVLGIKVFMRSYNDAIKCSNEIAQKDTATDHYKNYIKVLVTSLKQNMVMIDVNSQVMASSNLTAAHTLGLMKFAQVKHSQYGLNDI